MNDLYLYNNGKIIADGAMGTYFSMLTGETSSVCELANIDKPEVIAKIHNEYIKAGARLIRTNTFAANTTATGKPLDEVLKIVSEGYRIAFDCAYNSKISLQIAEPIHVAADIGPINMEDNDVFNEYAKIIDTFISNKADLFIFETFADTDHVNFMSDYIKKINPDATVIASFAFSPDGYTRSGVPIRKILDNLNSKVDILGFNCGSGPAHMYKLLRSIEVDLYNRNMIVSCMPNAGYASLENNRTVFTSSPEYFAESTAKFSDFCQIIGGCCGTTPEHIKKLSTLVNSGGLSAETVEVINLMNTPLNETANNFSSKLKKGEFVVSVEFSPPSNSDMFSLVEGSRKLKDAGADIITLSDSPLARVRMDSVIAAAKISREANVETLPHLCCRDRNVNALRSVILGAHSEGIRSILAVTGDLVPESERSIVKSVFNISSSRLMQLINEMNEDVFKGDGFIIGGALDVSSLNKSSELTKASRKISNGCSFFLTQPIYNTENLMIIREVRKQAKVLLGIMPIVSYRNAMYMKNEVPGFDIPDYIVNRFRPDMSKEEAIETGLTIAQNIAEKLRPEVDGFYFVAPFNRSDIICDLLKRLKVREVF
jgi:homocysteine S-methyltransferase